MDPWFVVVRCVLGVLGDLRQPRWPTHASRDIRRRRSRSSPRPLPRTRGRRRVCGSSVGTRLRERCLARLPGRRPGDERRGQGALPRRPGPRLPDGRPHPVPPPSGDRQVRDGRHLVRQPLARRNASVRDGTGRFTRRRSMPGAGAHRHRRQRAGSSGGGPNGSGSCGPSVRVRRHATP